MGFENAIIPYNTLFSIPSGAQRNAYEPHYYNLNVLDDLIGSNIVDYVGTSTGHDPIHLDDGDVIKAYVTGWKWGGVGDWSRTQHELGNGVGIDLLDGPSNGIQTSRDSDKSDNVELKDSKWDRAIMPYQLKPQALHFNSNWEYTMKERLGIAIQNGTI